jgi:hypothetical protein
VHTVGVLGSWSETKMIGWLVVQQDLFSWRSDSAVAASGCYARLLVCSYNPWRASRLNPVCHTGIKAALL